MSVCITRDTVFRYLFTNLEDFEQSSLPWTKIKEFYDVFQREVIAGGQGKIGYNYVCYVADEDLDRSRFLDFGDEVLCIKYDTDAEAAIEEKYGNDEVIVQALRKAKAAVLNKVVECV